MFEENEPTGNIVCTCLMMRARVPLASPIRDPVDDRVVSGSRRVTVDATRGAESSRSRLVLSGSIDGDGAQQEKEECEGVSDAVGERPAACGHYCDPAQEDERPGCRAIRTDQARDSDQRGHSTQDPHPGQRP